MKPTASFVNAFKDSLKKIYLVKVKGHHKCGCTSTVGAVRYWEGGNVPINHCLSCWQFKGYDVDEVSACTLLFEGSAAVSGCVGGWVCVFVTIRVNLVNALLVGVCFFLLYLNYPHSRWHMVRCGCNPPWNLYIS